MNAEFLFETIGDISEEYVKEAVQMERKKNYKWVKYAVAAAACLGIGVGAVAALSRTQPIETATADTAVSDTTTAPVNDNIISASSKTTTVANTTVPVTTTSPITENTTSSTAGNDVVTTTAPPQPEQPANGVWVGTGDNGAQTQPVIPLISSYDTGYIIDEDMAVMNGESELSYSLQGALKEYGDTVRYRVILEPFRDGAAVNDDDIIAAKEPDRLVGEGYTVALETFFNGRDEFNYVTLHAEAEQLYNFSAGTDFGYYICLYGERFGNSCDENLIVYNGNNSPIDGTVPGGSVPAALDPVKASIAVFPNSESLSDVADATLEEISETDAKALDGIGAYIPSVLPEGWFRQSANLYETTMNNGTVYRMLRIRYCRSGEDISVPGGESDYTDEFRISITNFEPKTEKPIYSIDELSEDIDLSETFHIAVGDAYAIVSADMLTYDEIMSVLNSMNG